MRERSNDGQRMSKRLIEEAEKYIEDLISNVEDTDISSLDGERSDTSSSLGGITDTNFPGRTNHVLPLIASGSISKVSRTNHVLPLSPDPFARGSGNQTGPNSCGEWGIYFKLKEL
ncbi:hypothetical protein SLEP1_g24807 [Rubroshorea leprosula]|uniref:Uncharacterized protein n=1 Tax=Rubroshorea leprosula TaxID=152421 RepID=A0AAV5JH12_9ROSI|nr:hypothetical protein SLEP1_g24807 [Rubroshorea leprosula]